MENTMGHECCKIRPVPVKPMFFFLMTFVPWCLEAFVLSKFCCTAGFVIQFTEKYTLEEYNGFEYKWVSGSHTKDKCNP